jgi:hypothetical protein
MCNVFLIGYGVVVGFNVGDEKPPHYEGLSKKRSKKRTVARIRCCSGGRKASATGVKVAGIGTSNIKAKELDSPLAWGAGVVGGSVPTAGAAAAEGVIGGREEADKSSRASSAGNQGLS